MRILRRRTLERRLFFWLIGLALIPAFVVLGAGVWVGRGTLDWLGTLGPWAEVSESGRALIEAAEPLASSDSALARTLESHRAQLTASLTQASRWSFLGARVVAALPLALLLFALLLIIAALLISRRLARQLSRPIHELAGWTDLMAQEQALPPPTPAEAREVREVQALRQSLRRASVELWAGRERALQQERIRAWGEMARRIAHEMKNPLTPLRLAAHKLNDASDKRAQLSEPLRVIDEETRRLEQLAHEFSLLGRPATGPHSAVDVVELLSSLAQTDVPENVRVAVHAGAELPLVLANYNALQQALRNVLRNAVEAVGNRADACIEIGIDLPGANGQLHLTVADNGPGFAPGTAERAFEPDYTTKPRGTGLGLAIARQTIEEHGGSINAASRAAGGAQVEIRLPVQTAARA